MSIKIASFGNNKNTFYKVFLTVVPWLWDHKFLYATILQL